jgi:SPP1 gp7 family putative phage head morphogenesis protein
MHRPTTHAATIALIRHLSAYRLVRPRRRVGRIPPPVQPLAIMRAYRDEIVGRVCEVALHCVERELPDIFHALASRSDDGAAIGFGRAAQLGEAAGAKEERQAREQAGRFGRELRAASAQGERAARAIDRAARELADAFAPAALRELVARFGERMDLHARLQLDQQLRSAIGVPLSAIEKPTRDRIEEWAARNVDLIATIPDRYFDRLRRDVLDAFASGTSRGELSERIEDDYGASESDADRIARDQLLKLASDVTHDRMESLGVLRATWRIVQDESVCADCEANEGVEYSLDEGIDGVLPGHCHPIDRCWPEPDLEPLIGGGSEGAGESEDDA